MMMIWASYKDMGERKDTSASDRLREMSLLESSQMSHAVIIYTCPVASH
jgi:hypothetical protein